jgi:hypothetical protein
MTPNNARFAKSIGSFVLGLLVIGGTGSGGNGDSLPSAPKPAVAVAAASPDPSRAVCALQTALR